MRGDDLTFPVGVYLTCVALRKSFSSRNLPVGPLRARRSILCLMGGHHVHSRYFCTLFFVVALCLPSISDAHRSGCHRWHSCPSDRGTYECGDSGHCSRCPDNKYCKAGNPRTVERRPSQTPRPSQQPSAPPSRYFASTSISTSRTAACTRCRKRRFTLDPGQNCGTAIGWRETINSSNHVKASARAA